MSHVSLDSSQTGLTAEKNLMTLYSLLVFELYTDPSPETFKSNWTGWQISSNLSLPLKMPRSYPSPRAKDFQVPIIFTGLILLRKRASILSTQLRLLLLLLQLKLISDISINSK